MNELDRIDAEIAEKSLDLETFVQARALIRARVLAVADSESTLTPLPRWSGTDAALGTLDLCIHSMERTIEELKQVRKAVESGRKFRVIEGDHGDEG